MRAVTFFLLAALACLSGNVEAARVVRKPKANPDIDPNLPINNAVMSGDLQAVLAELDKGGPIDHIGRGGQTPLMTASLQGHAAIVKALLERGADVSIGEKDGYTPLHGCAFQGRADVCRVLMEHGVKHEKHQDSFYPLHRAAWGREPRHADTVRVFLEQGVDPNLESDGPTGGAALWMTKNELSAAVLREYGAKELPEEYTPVSEEDAKKHVEKAQEELKEALEKVKGLDPNSPETMKLLDENGEYVIKANGLSKEHKKAAAEEAAKRKKNEGKVEL